MPLSPSVTTRLKHQHESIAELAKGLTEEQLKQEINPGKWSAFENIVHLVTYQYTFFARMQLIEKAGNPVFERYTADNDPLFHTYKSKSLAALLEDLHTQRFLINNHLLQLNETKLRCEGIHPVYGRFSLAQWTDFFLLHEAHHLFSIFMLTAASRKAIQQ